MHIGLVGGIGPAATDLYYRRLISHAQASGVQLELTMAHADSSRLLANMSENAQDEQVEVYIKLAARLARAGAECMAITSISGHFCIDKFLPKAPIEVVDMTTVLRQRLKDRDIEKVGILGTRTVMETGIFGKLADTEIIAPAGREMDRVHDAYVELANAGVASKETRDVLFAAGRNLIESAGVGAVLLAGTDLNIAFDGKDCGFRTVDCLEAHVSELVRYILQDAGSGRKM
ncbi:MAG: aspartate/glutamate racemase family protein [Pseudomonadota bacterium]